MGRTAAVALALVAAIHFGISAVEMFFWLNPAVHHRLGFSADQASKAHPIVMNAGLYNGFIAAGLLWGALGGGGSFPIRVFFLACVVIAGLFGAATLPSTTSSIPTTLWLQTLPGLIALALVWAARPRA
jgi:putative membrane protein